MTEKKIYIPNFDGTNDREEWQHIAENDLNQGLEFFGIIDEAAAELRDKGATDNDIPSLLRQYADIFEKEKD